MIICRRCSRRHPDGTEFCTCGAYLEFDGEPASDEVGTTPAGTARGGEERPAGPPDAAGSGGAVGAWSGLPGDGADDRTRAVLPDDVSTSGAPTQEYQTPTTVRPDARPCPSCRTPNPPEATFCRHCALDLRAPTGVVAEERPPKRRWFRGRRVNARTVANAARRPGGGGGVARRVMMFRVGGALLAGGLLVAFLGPWGRPALGTVGDELSLSRYDQIDVDGDDVTARSIAGPDVPAVDLPYHSPDLVVDGLSNTSWATRWIDPAKIGDDLPPDGCVGWETDQLLVVDFGAPTDLDRVQVLAGRSADDPTRDDFHRPAAIQFEHDGECRRATLDDEGELSAHDLSLDGVTLLTVGVVAIHEGDTTDATVELTELVFEHK